MQRNRGLHRSKRGQSCRRLTTGGGTILPTMRERADRTPAAHCETIGTQTAEEVKTRWQSSASRGLSEKSATKVM